MAFVEAHRIKANDAIDEREGKLSGARIENSNRGRNRTNEIPKSGIFGRKSKNDRFSRVSNGSLDKVERVERGDTITILRYTKRGE